MKHCSLYFTLLLPVLVGCGQARPPKQASLNMPVRAPNPELEKVLESWKPGPANAVPPPLKYLRKDVVLGGIWRKKAGRGSLFLKIVAVGGGKYNVICTQIGDVPAAGWTLGRTASYKDGILTFDRPISLKSSVCRKLYTVQVADRHLLLSPTNVKEFVSLVEEGRSTILSVASFERTPVGR